MPSTVQDLLKQNGLNFKTIKVEDTQSTPITTKVERNIDNIKKFYDTSYSLNSSIKDIQFRVNVLRRKTVKTNEVDYNDAAVKLQYIKDNAIPFLHYDEYTKLKDLAVSESNKDFTTEFTNKTSNHIVSYAVITVGKLLAYKKIISDCNKTYQKLTYFTMYESGSVGLTVSVEKDTDIQFCRCVNAIIGKSDEINYGNYTFTQEDIRKWKIRMLDEQKIQQIINLLNNITEYKRVCKNKSVTEIIEQIKQIAKTTNMIDKTKKALDRFFEESEKRIEEEKVINKVEERTQDRLVTKQIKSRYKEIDLNYQDLMKSITKFEQEIFRNVKSKTNLPVEYRYQLILRDITAKLAITPDKQLDKLEIMNYLENECNHYRAVIFSFRKAVREGKIEINNERVKNYILNYPFKGGNNKYD